MARSRLSLVGLVSGSGLAVALVSLGVATAGAKRSAVRQTPARAALSAPRATALSRLLQGESDRPAAETSVRSWASGSAAALERAHESCGCV
jgi:hypothetical protein